MSGLYFNLLWRKQGIARNQKKNRINEDIKLTEIRLIDATGENKGLTSFAGYGQVSLEFNDIVISTVF